MVSPEGTGPEPDRPKSGRGLLFAIAALVIAGGFMALGGLSPASQATPETTTTTQAIATTTEELPPPFDPENFQVSQIETGPQFEWTRTLTLEEGYPLGLIEHSDSLYLFVNERPFWRGDSENLTIWEWDGSGEWHSPGSIVGGLHSVVAMTTHGAEVMLVGNSSEGGAMSLWRSTDMGIWTREDIPLEADDQDKTVFPAAVGANGDLVMVAGSLSMNPKTIEDALHEAGYPVDLLQWGWWLDGDAVVISGPFGVTIDRVAFSELGWDEDTKASIVRSYRGRSESKTWIQRDGGAWEAIELEELEGVESILPYPGGGLVATGWSSSNYVRLVSTDGMKWTRLDGNETPWQVDTWGDRFVAATDRSLPGFFVSNDGETWEAFGPDGLFPEGINWSTETLAASDDGVAFTTTGVSPGLPSTTPSERVPPIRLDIGDGATLILDFESGRLDLEKESDSFSWQMYGPSSDQDGISADPEEQTLLLTDPETGYILATVPFDVLQDAEVDFYRQRAPETGHRALVFTPDGTTWTIQDVPSRFGDSNLLGELLIGTNQVAAIVVPDGWWDMEGGFEVWTAPLP